MHIWQIHQGQFKLFYSRELIINAVTFYYSLLCNLKYEGYADAVAVDIINAKALHQFCISGSDIFTVYLCCYTVSADLFDVRDTASVDQFSICSLQTLADRMVGSQRFFQMSLLPSSARSSVTSSAYSS